MGSPRRHIARWEPDGMILSIEVDGHRCYRVTTRLGDRLEQSVEFDDGIDARRYWIDLQRSYLDGLASILPPPLSAPPSEVVDLTDVDDDPGYVGEYPPIGRVYE